MPDPVVERLDLRRAGHQALTPFLVQRIQAYAQAYQPEVYASEYAAKILARLWDHEIQLAAYLVVDPTSGHLLGHALAEYATLLGSTFVVVTQMPERILGPTRFTVIDQIVDWSTRIRCGRIIFQTDKSEKALQQRYGAKLYRYCLQIPLEAPVAFVKDGHGPVVYPLPPTTPAETNGADPVAVPAGA